MPAASSDGGPAQPAAPRPARSRRVRWLTCLAALPAGLVVAELAVRVVGVHARPLPEVQGTVTEHVDDEVQKFENRAGGRRVLVYRDRVGGPPRRVVMLTNAQRFRGPEVERLKPPGVLRIACVGDSHTFGFGVPEGETFPDHLRARLAAEPGWAPVEVLNCGVTAYDTLQEALWLERRVLAFEPDLVVLQYFLNDVAARGVGGGDGLSWWLRLTHPRQVGTIAVLRRHSRALDVLCDAVFRAGYLRGYLRGVRVQYAEDGPGWRRSREALLRMRDVCRERGVRMVVALYPYLYREPGAERFASAPALDTVRAFCAEAGLECFDGEPALLREEVDDLRVSPHDYHANERAHRLFGDALGDYLVARGRSF